MQHLRLQLLILFLAPTALACVFKNSAEPYWPKAEIPVCFMAPEGNLSFEMRRAQMTIKKAYESQFNKRTDLNFTGFGTCTADQLQPGFVVRIALVQGLGGAAASNVGPSSALDVPNLSVDYLPIDPHTNQADYDPRVITHGVLHETLHLLGFLHDIPRDNKRRLASIQKHEPLLVGDYDHQSMVVNSQTTELSEGDIFCINGIAKKEIIKDKSLAAELESLSVDLGNNDPLDKMPKKSEK